MSLAYESSAVNEVLQLPWKVDAIPLNEMETAMNLQTVLMLDFK